MKKISFILILLLLCTTICKADDQGDITLYHYAVFLDRIGILKGNENGYELSKTVTRSEAVTMLVRLMGKESEAFSTEGVYPFYDSGWADKSVLYLYNNNLTKGISNTEFGINMLVTRNQFCTFVLRALGYFENENDFTYDNAEEFAKQVLNISFSDTEFTRGEMAKICYYALFSNYKNTDIPLSAIAVSNATALNEATAEFNRNTKKCDSVNVMIYMVASDLESLLGRATDDIEEMLKTEAGKNVNVYIMAGGTAKWKNDYIKNTNTQLFRLADKQLSLVESCDDKKMCDVGTLTYFISKCKSISACDRNILLLWDHGEGTMGGFGRDELNGNKAISILDLKNGIKNSGVYFDIIGFDACLMGTAETVYAMKELCSYLIASEELEPSCGWYYTTWLNTLEKNPSIDLLVLSKLIVDSATVHSAIETNADSVFAVINTSFAQALYDHLSSTLSNTEQEQYALSIQNANALGAREGGYDQFDISQIFDEANTALYNCVNKAVIYKRLSSPFMKSCGLAFYSPKQHLNQYDGVKKMLLSLGYNQEYFETLEK